MLDKLEDFLFGDMVEKRTASKSRVAQINEQTMLLVTACQDKNKEIARLRGVVEQQAKEIEFLRGMVTQLSNK